MSRLRLRIAALLAFGFACGMVADAQAGPVVGGEVPMVLSLSLSQPSGFRPARTGDARDRETTYSATGKVAVTATEAPLRLSIADAEAIAGARDGHLVRGARVLSPVLQAAAGRSRFVTLAGSFPPVLEQWSRPVASQDATIRLHQSFSGVAGELASYHKTLLVTVAVAGP